MKWVHEQLKWKVSKHIQYNLSLLFLCLKELLVGQSQRSDQETKRHAGLTESLGGHTKAGPSYDMTVPLIYMVTMWRSSLM
jgi:hypothetical protein